MSLMPFSSRSSSRSSGGGDAGGEKKLSNRKYTISLSFSGLITSGIITIIAKQVLVKMGLKDATQVSKKPVRGR